MTGDDAPKIDRGMIPYAPEVSILARGLALVREIDRTPDRIRIVIVDDIDDITSNLSKLLGFEPDMEVVGVAFDGKAAIDLTRAKQPDIVLMDIYMPVLDGITATEVICRDQAWTGAVIMTSVAGSQDYLRRSSAAGAMEYLVKPFTADALVLAIRFVHHMNGFPDRRCTCRVDADELPADVNEPYGLLMEMGDDVWDRLMDKHGTVMAVYNPASHANASWNLDNAGLLFRVRYTDGTEGDVWGVSLLPWMDPLMRHEDRRCAECGDRWSEHFGHAGKRRCRVCPDTDDEAGTACEDYRPGEDSTTVIDLMTALRESVRKARELESRHAFIVTYHTDDGEVEKEEVCPACAAGQDPTTYLSELGAQIDVSDEQYEHNGGLVAMHHANVQWTTASRNRGSSS